jgi:hypothetical protein
MERSMSKPHYSRKQLEAEAQALAYQLAMRKYSKQIAGYIKEARSIAADIRKTIPSPTYDNGKPYTTKGKKRVYRPDGSYFYK